jgi:hypothetical protein
MKSLVRLSLQSERRASKRWPHGQTFAICANGAMRAIFARLGG